MTPEDVEGFKQSLEVARKYAGFIVRPALEELGGMLADTVGHWRLKNQVNCILKTKKFLEKKGIHPGKAKPLVPNVFVPLLEAAGNTDDPELSDMFSRLLASHIDADEKQVHPAFSTVLSQMSSLDAQVLRYIDSKEQLEDDLRKKGQLKPSETLQWGTVSVVKNLKDRMPKIDASEFALSVHNLMRLGILEDESFILEVLDAPVEPDGLIITEFGIRFLAACSDSDHWRKKHKGNKWEKVVEFVKGEPKKKAPYDAIPE